MKKQFKKILAIALVVACFSSTVAMAANSGTYNFTLMTGESGYSSKVVKNTELSYAVVNCTKLSQPSATLRYIIKDKDLKTVGATSKRGTGSFSVDYSEAVGKNQSLQLVVNNLAENGGVTVTTGGTWTP